MQQPAPCPVCGTDVVSLHALATHLVAQAEASDGAHVMWLNRNVTKRRSSPADLEPVLASLLGGHPAGRDRVRR